MMEETEEQETPNTLEKEEVLQLIISQLQYIDMENAAQIIAESSNITPAYSASSRLAELLYLGTKAETVNEDIHPSAADEDDAEEDEDRCLNIEQDGNTKIASRVAPNYSTLYTTSHKASCRVAVYSQDGKYIATGSADTSLKVLDVAKMKMRTDEERPVIRTLYDHVSTVTDISWHPGGLALASASEDKSIKIYDLQKPSVKRSFRYLQDAYPVRSICFHPSGDFILAGSDHPAVRIYDVKSFQCYIPPNPNDYHRSRINQVNYAPKGDIFATCSDDGSIKFYNGVTGQCINTIEQAHGGTSVSSVKFSRNSKYLLSNGKDSIGRLWDLASGKVVQKYEGALQMKTSCNITFTYNEDFVLSSDETNNTIVCWDSRTGSLLQRWTGPTGVVHCVAASPTGPDFVTCSDDNKARYWNIEI